MAHQWSMPSMRLAANWRDVGLVDTRTETLKLSETLSAWAFTAAISTHMLDLNPPSYHYIKIQRFWALSECVCVCMCESIIHPSIHQSCMQLLATTGPQCHQIITAAPPASAHGSLIYWQISSVPLKMMSLPKITPPRWASITQSFLCPSQMEYQYSVYI